MRAHHFPRVVAAIGVVLIVTAGLALPATAFARAGDIVYTYGNWGTLAVMTGSGTPVRDLVASGGDESVVNGGPVWGPPGQSRVAFWQSSGTPGGRGSGILIATNETSPTLRNIGEPVPWRSGLWDMRPEPSGPIAWSPSGRYLVYGASGWDHPSSSAHYSYLVAVDLHHDPATTFTVSRTSRAGWTYSSLDFTPDGRSLLICEAGDDGHGHTAGLLKKISFSARSALLKLYPDQAGYSDLSYDGLTIAYTAVGGGPIRTCSAATGLQRRTVRSDATGIEPRFSRDKKWIAYYVAGTTGSIMRVPFGGASAPVLLMDNAGDPDW